MTVRAVDVPKASAVLFNSRDHRPDREGGADRLDRAE